MKPLFTQISKRLVPINDGLLAKVASLRTLLNGVAMGPEIDDADSFSQVDFHASKPGAIFDRLFDRVAIRL